MLRDINDTYSYFLVEYIAVNNTIDVTYALD